MCGADAAFSRVSYVHVHVRIYSVLTFELNGLHTYSNNWQVAPAVRYHKYIV